jgi:hypothetical protein
VERVANRAWTPYCRFHPMDEARITVEQSSDHFPQPWQYYETTLVVNVDGSDVPVTFASVPARSVSEMDRTKLGTLEGLAGFVGAKPRDAIVLNTIGHITTAVGLMIDPLLRPESARVPHSIWAEFRRNIGAPRRTTPIGRSFVLPPKA